MNISDAKLLIEEQNFLIALFNKVLKVRKNRKPRNNFVTLTLLAVLSTLF